MFNCESSSHKFSLHGLAVELRCSVPSLWPQIEHLLHPFVAEQLPDGFIPASGHILPYDEASVVRHLSPSAVRLPTRHDLLELYQDGERFWLIDERCGLVEMNLLKGQWKSWILPHPTTDHVRLAELALLWPLAQLLRPRGLSLAPAVGLSRTGWGILMVVPFGIEPELRTLIRAGYRVVGQRWTALREEAPNAPVDKTQPSRLQMLHMPGQVERYCSPHMRDRTALSPSSWLDLHGEYIGSTQSHAFADAVLIVEPGRRPKAHLNELPPPRAVEALRAAWPIPDLHPTRRISQLPIRIAQRCRCCELQLSRNSNDLLVLLDSLRYSPAGGFKPQVHVNSSVTVLRPEHVPRSEVA